MRRSAGRNRALPEPGYVLGPDVQAQPPESSGCRRTPPQPLHAALPAAEFSGTVGPRKLLELTGTHQLFPITRPDQHD